MSYVGQSLRQRMRVLTHRLTRFQLCALLLVTCIASWHAYAQDFIAFESGPVRPMALSPDGSFLYVVNPPDNRLEVYGVKDDGTLAYATSIPVGMEPVSVAANGYEEVWVVNHLSDSISVVDVRSLRSSSTSISSPPFVSRTLLVGDEPRDIVFANNRAFITTAHRGQHRTHPSIAHIEGAGDPQLHTAGIARADVWIFDAAHPGEGFGGTPLKIVELFGDTPRALTVSRDGRTVYAAVFNSGNQTTVVHEGVMCRGFEDTPAGFFVGATWDRRNGNQPCVAGHMPARLASRSPNGPADKTLPKGRPLPSRGADNEHAPFTAMIVKWDRAAGEWQDSRGLNYSNGIRFFLPDKDVFAIDTESLEEVKHFSHVGTTLFNMAVNPANGNVYVSNTDSQNHVRFEGPGIRGGSTVQGNLAQAQITVLDPLTDTVRARHLNRHINYDILKTSPETRSHSLATPLEMQFSPDGSKLYVAALGSSRVGVINTAELEDDAFWDGSGAEFDPTAASAEYLNVGGGPAGLVHGTARDGSGARLYVFLHFARGISTINPESGEFLQSVRFHNPEPTTVISGRPMLYDANGFSSNGEASCASCHIFGDTDHMSWDLGNPDDVNAANPQPFPTFSDFWLNCDIYGHYRGCESVPYVNGNGEQRDFSSMKGPMATQTMRGMSTHGHLHWRGDRANGYFGVDTERTLDEKFSFMNFIVAVEGLLGRDVALSSVDEQEKSNEVRRLERDIEAFADFILAVQLPPNPIRSLNRELSTSAQKGRDFFDGERRADGLGPDYDLPNNLNGLEPDGRNCAGCHALDPLNGFYGTSGDAAHGGEVLILKVPHLRNLYQKVGTFGLPNREFFLPSTTDQHQGDQIRGFGFLHDGATDKLFNFLQGAVFDDGTTSCEDLDLSSGQLPVYNIFGCDFNDGMDVGIPGDEVRQGLVDFMMEFDSDLAPAVGQQVTLIDSNDSETAARIDLLIERAATPFESFVLGGMTTDCDLIAKGRVGGQTRGWVLQDDGTFLDDVGGTASDAEVRAFAISDGPITYTCTPPGSGYRMGIDRDRDSVLDGLDNCPHVSNPDQVDSDADGIGDVCELSDD